MIQILIFPEALGSLLGVMPSRKVLIVLLGKQVY
jgi:hypothetical protein